MRSEYSFRSCYFDPWTFFQQEVDCGSGVVEAGFWFRCLFLLDEAFRKSETVLTLWLSDTGFNAGFIASRTWWGVELWAAVRGFGSSAICGWKAWGMLVVGTETLQLARSDKFLTGSHTFAIVGFFVLLGSSRQFVHLLVRVCHSSGRRVVLARAKSSSSNLCWRASLVSGCNLCWRNVHLV